MQREMSEEKGRIVDEDICVEELERGCLYGNQYFHYFPVMGLSGLLWCVYRNKPFFFL